MHLKNLPQFVRYVSHTHYAEVVNARVIPPPVPNPYSVVLVESPELTTQLTLNVDQKIDFYNLWLMTDRGMHEILEWEILIRYKPATGLKSLLTKMWPKLEYLVFTRGHLEKMLVGEADDTYPRCRFYADKIPSNFTPLA
jgi:hypothetical protein